ncbi:hypothetical protein [Nocardia sp. X0981]
MAAAKAAGGGYLLRCEALDRTVDAAVTEGEITMSTRSEPDVAPLAAKETVTPLR